MADESIRFGDDALQRGAFDQAIEHYDAALKADRNAERAWIGRARVMRTLGRLGDAEDAYIKAVEIAPQNVVAWIELVQLEFEGGADEVAEENLAAALRLHPGHADLVALRKGRAAQDEPEAPALLLVQLRRALVAEATVAAYDTLDALLLEHGDDPLAAVARAEVFLAFGEDDPLDLIHTLNRVSREHPNNWEAISAHGRLMLVKSPLRNVRMGVALCEDAWRISAEHPRASLALVEAWSHVGKHQLAHALCQRVAAGEGPESALAGQWLDEAEDEGEGEEPPPEEDPAAERRGPRGAGERSASTSPAAKKTQ